MDTSRRRRLLALSTHLVLLALAVVAQDNTEKSKRQIFREQVLPHSGGKIPESAFRTDRLALNKLQKLGVAVPDGVSLDTRSNNVLRVAHDPETEYTVVRILQEDEGRYVPPEGRSYPDYPPTVQSTYIIRPPIGAYRFGPHIHRAIQGPPLSFGGASVGATTGAHQGPLHQQYGPPAHYDEQEVHGQYGPPYQNYERFDHIGLGNIPAPTPSPEHSRYVHQAGLNVDFHPSPPAPISTPNYPGLYAAILRSYAAHGGLLRLASPIRYSTSVPWSAYPGSHFSGSALSLLDQDDLAFRLRRRTGDEEVSPAASERRETSTGAATSSASHVLTSMQPRSDFSCEGRDVGNVYSDPLSNCKKQFLCLEDGRAAAYLCPEGSSFDHRARKCSNRRRRRVKLDAECNPV